MSAKLRQKERGGGVGVGKSDEMKTEPKRAVESFLTGKVLQQLLLMVKTLGKERGRA